MAVDVTSVKLERYGFRARLSWEARGALFHTWIGADGCPEPFCYKLPRCGLMPGDPGYCRPTRLNLNSKPSLRMYEAARSIADGHTNSPGARVREGSWWSGTVPGEYFSTDDTPHL